MSVYRVLSLDGGGIRGIFTARLIERLDQAIPGFLKTFDLFAGTSTGGILALGLAAGIEPHELVCLYHDNGAMIFTDKPFDVLDLGNVVGAKYDNLNLNRLLTRVFETWGVSTLNNLKKRVLIPTFDLDDGQDPHRKPDKPRTWKPKFFHNYPGSDSDGTERVVDVALRTCAAPTYFPSYGRFIDGGVVVNNPSMAALAQALNKPTGNRELHDIHLLSLGTGINQAYIQGQDHDWGIAQWANPLSQWSLSLNHPIPSIPILSIMMDGGMSVVDYQCRQLLEDRYHRLTCFLDSVIALDCYQKVDELIKYADTTDISETVEWIQQFVVADSTN